MPARRLEQAPRTPEVDGIEDQIAGAASLEDLASVLYYANPSIKRSDGVEYPPEFWTGMVATVKEFFIHGGVVESPVLEDLLAKITRTHGIRDKFRELVAIEFPHNGLAEQRPTPIRRDAQVIEVSPEQLAAMRERVADADEKGIGGLLKKLGIRR